jgi:hypothetical protein
MRQIKSWSWVSSLYLLVLLGLAAALIYGAAQREDVERLDRNVPGATTGQGKSSLTR